VSEPGKVSHQCAGICEGTDQHENTRPDANPGVRRQERDIVLLALHVKQSCENGYRSRSTKYRQWLAGGQGKEYATNRRDHQHLTNTNLKAGEVPSQCSESNRVCQCGEI